MARSQALFKATPFRTGCLVILLSCVLYYSISRSENTLLLSFDAQVFSTMFKSRGSMATTGQIAIVDIDEKSLARLGQWPWSRDKLAALVRKIDDAGARVVGLDMIFPEPDRTSPSNWFRKIETKSDHTMTDQIGSLKVHLQGQKIYDYDAILGRCPFSKFGGDRFCLWIFRIF